MMADDLERELNRAIEAFLTSIVRAALRAAIVALRAALAGSSVDGARAIGMQTAPQARRVPTPTDAATLASRIVACVDAHPGSTVLQLAPCVGVHATTLRRHL